MRTLLTLVLALLCGTAGAATFQNSFTTNSTGRTPNVLPTNANAIYPLMVLKPDGSGIDREILYSPYIFLQGSNLFVNGAVVGNGGGGATTNYYSTIITTNLTVLNSLTVSNITVTNITVQNNLTVSNLFTVNGNHNTLIVTNALTLQTVKTNVLATTSSGLITNVNYGTGISWDPATLTLSASGGGSSALTFNTLTYSGTNVTVDCSLGDTNGAAYKLTLTNAANFVTPTSVPTTAKGFQIWFQQPSTGTVVVTWTNGTYKFPGAVQPVIDTNNSAVTVVTFATGPFTNSLLNFIGLTPQIQ